MKPLASGTENTLRQALAEKDFEVLSAAVEETGNSIRVQANKLQPVEAGGEEPLYIPVPVTLRVELKKNKAIAGISGGEPAPEAAKSAESFAKMLIANHQVAGLGGQEAANASHAVVKNERGQNIIRRRGFTNRMVDA